MRTWRTLPEERSQLYSPVGLLPRDDVTGRAPIGTLQAYLDARDPGANWRRTDVRAVITQSGVITFPGLGRQRAPLGQPARRYRVRVTADHYIPRYRRDQEGIVFDAHPYDDENPPASAPDAPSLLVLLPGPSYPFPGHLLVLRGVVVDATGTPVPDAEVSIGATRRTLSDLRGVFAIATDRPAAPTSFPLDATDLRTTRTGSVVVQFPLGLVCNLQITIS